MKTRVGKIARLPKQIRDQLNQRLENGERGSTIVQWLNQLPEVQKILAEQFAGKAIRAQNLSQWRHGGYAEWAAGRHGRAQWQDLLDHIHELSEERNFGNGKDVTSHLGTLVVLELAKVLEQLGQMEDSAERWKIFRLLSLNLSRLRRDDCREERIRLSNSKTVAKNRPFKPDPTNANHKKNSFLIPSADLQSA